jgi:benzodiazapine receptor
MPISFITIPCIIICVALAGSYFTTRGLSWYNRDVRVPAWTPSGRVIGAVWTVLFTLLAITFIIFWRTRNSADSSHIIILAFVNGVFNIGWSYLFFGRHKLRTAIFCAALLSVTGFGLVGLLWPHYVWSAILLLPYPLWTSFATYLNYSVWRLNK